MCNHVWKTVNDVRVCLRCGITVVRNNGKVIFDRKLTDTVQKGRKDK